MISQLNGKTYTKHRSLQFSKQEIITYIKVISNLWDFPIAYWKKIECEKVIFSCLSINQVLLWIEIKIDSWTRLSFNLSRRSLFVWYHHSMRIEQMYWLETSSWVIKWQWQNKVYSKPQIFDRRTREHQ